MKINISGTPGAIKIILLLFVRDLTNYDWKGPMIRIKSNDRVRPTHS